MPEAHTATISNAELLEKIFLESWPWYDIESLVQNQLSKTGRGRKTVTHRRCHIRTDEDSQSDYTVVALFWSESKKSHAALDLLKQRFFEKLSNRAWKSGHIFDVEDPIEYVRVIDQASNRETDIKDDDISQWPSDKLESALMDTKAESDMPHLREVILFAEDTDFTVAQSEQLAPRLLSFAKKYRDSNNPQDEAAVWSAIRTGASMLRPNAADCLRPLLEPGHSIETSLVTVKMLGRIFEAQPPAEVDKYKDLANEVYHIAESLLNRYVITASQSAAMAHLAIYALAAMASSKTQQIVETVKQLGVMWFTRRTFRKLCELRNTWSSRPAPVADQPRKLLDRVIQVLESSDAPASGGTDALH